jgi:hypothetical protein
MCCFVSFCLGRVGLGIVDRGPGIPTQLGPGGPSEMSLLDLHQSVIADPVVFLSNLTLILLAVRPTLGIPGQGLDGNVPSKLCGLVKFWLWPEGVIHLCSSTVKRVSLFFVFGRGGRWKSSICGPLPGSTQARWASIASSFSSVDQFSSHVFALEFALVIC